MKKLQGVTITLEPSLVSEVFVSVVGQMIQESARGKTLHTSHFAGMTVGTIHYETWIVPVASVPLKLDAVDLIWARNMRLLIIHCLRVPQPIDGKHLLMLAVDMTKMSDPETLGVYSLEVGEYPLRFDPDEHPYFLPTTMS